MGSSCSALLEQSTLLLKLTVPVVQLCSVPELARGSDGDVFDAEVDAKHRTVLGVAFGGSLELHVRLCSDVRIELSLLQPIRLLHSLLKVGGFTLNYAEDDG